MTDPQPPAADRATGPAAGSAGRALVVTVSTRAAAGTGEDLSGPILARGLATMGFVVDGPRVVADGAPVTAALSDALAGGYDVVLTTGGTGLTPTDRTPEATRQLLERDLPGIPEALRAYGISRGVPTAMLSRGVAGTVGDTVVVNLPGSPGGCADGIVVLFPVLPHLVSQLRGGDHPRHRPR